MAWRTTLPHAILPMSRHPLRPVLAAKRFTSPSLYGRSLSTRKESRVAVLYQEIEPPTINGVRKPKKPGGYKDSGADIAYTLSSAQDIRVIYPTDSPQPEFDSDWCFPDTKDGILWALDKGATHLWANTSLFAAHPLQTSARIAAFQDDVRVVGQGPLVVDKYDDKEHVNNLLRAHGGFTLPWAWTIRHDGPRDFTDRLCDLRLPFPIVAKPIRGRGSHGVRVCDSLEDLLGHTRHLFQESPAVMLEEFLVGEEVTVTVMPPGTTADGADYWSLPVVERTGHRDGVAPYNGVVAVAENSRAVLDMRDPAYGLVMAECERAARLLGVAAPIRIDARRPKDSPESKFALFDVNMKPNMTGPGRPGRDNQASLTLLAAAALGWDYRELLRRILLTSVTLRTLRSLTPLGR